MYIHDSAEGHNAWFLVPMEGRVDLHNLLEIDYLIKYVGTNRFSPMWLKFATTDLEKVRDVPRILILTSGCFSIILINIVPKIIYILKLQIGNI